MAKNLAFPIKRQFASLRSTLIGLFIALLLLQVAAFIVLILVVWGEPALDWLPELLIATFFLAVAGGATIAALAVYAGRLEEQVGRIADKEVERFEAKRAKAMTLEVLSSPMMSGSGFEQVMEVALNSYTRILEHLGVAPAALVGAVYLFDGDALVAVASRGLIDQDADQALVGRSGILGRALGQAEPSYTAEPDQDPELNKVSPFRDCAMVICVPLHAGFEIYGVVLLGSPTLVELSPKDLELLVSIADQTLISLQNADLHQRLTSEKQRMLQVEEEVRKELAHALHDGPTQSVASIAMRISFIRSLMINNPDQAMKELAKVEQVARQTTQEIRGMLYTVPPVALETSGLNTAIEMIAARIGESNGLRVHFTGGDFEDALDEEAKMVTFYVVEEAINNAQKHANASLIDVRLVTENGFFVARVQDNGVGFDIEQVNANYGAQGCLGLLSMRQRAERGRGKLTIDSTPGKGTLVRLVLPMRKPARTESMV